MSGYLHEEAPQDWETWGTVLAYEERDGGDSSVYRVDFLDIPACVEIPANQLVRPSTIQTLTHRRLSVRLHRQGLAVT
jgi:hypothetical protein